MASNWTDRLRELICKLFKAWGGDCVNLGITPSEWVSAIVTIYAQQGVPPLPDPGTRAQFLMDLDELEVHLAKPGNDLSPADNAALTEFIASIRGELSES